MAEDPRVEVAINVNNKINLVPTRLRTTALSIRHYAEKATPGRWKLWGMQVMGDVLKTGITDDAEPVAIGVTPAKDQPNIRTWNSDHIAHWDPTMALTVAGFMEWVADAREAIDAVSDTQGQGSEMFLTAEKHALNMMEAFTKGSG